MEGEKRNDETPVPVDLNSLAEIELNEDETELDEEEITLKKCPKCQSEVKINISRSQRNPNRKYYKCL